jgi:hypothetical protein
MDRQLHLTIPKSQPAVEGRNLSLDVCPNSETGDWSSSKAGMLYAARWPQATRESLIPSEAALQATRESRNIS